MQGVAGYRVYTRTSGQSYGAGTDVGLLSADLDGVIRYVVRGLSLDVTYYFAVTAYDSAGRESAFSNELSLLITATPTPTSAAATATASRTPTTTATASRTPTTTATASRTPTTTATAPGTSTASATVTRTPTVTLTPTTAISTPTPTPTPSATFAGSGYAVSGRINFLADGAAVADATLTLQGTLGTLTATTDATGAFSFSGLGAATWNLTPRKQADQRSGVSALDASYVLQRLAGMRDFAAWQTFICDVTGNGTLSALDAVRILEFAVGSRARLPVADACGSDWAFLPQPLLVPFEQVVQPVLSNTNCQLGAVGFAPLSADAPQQNFAAVLIGDCTGNWQGGSGAALRRRAPAARARLGAVRARPGGRWLVGLHIDGVEDLDALEIHVAYDPSAATLEDVHAVGAATGALAAYRADTSGIVSIALASAERIEPGDRPLAVFVLAATDPPQLRLLDAVVDDAPVGVGD